MDKGAAAPCENGCCESIGEGFFGCAGACNCPEYPLGTTGAGEWRGGIVKRGSALVVGYEGDGGTGLREAMMGGRGGNMGGSPCPGDVDFGSMESRFMSSCILFCSAAACPPAALFFVCSIWCSSCAPSALRLLTNESTFFSKLSTLSFISV